jgi:hypothetical protein
LCRSGPRPLPGRGWSQPSTGQASATAGRECRSSGREYADRPGLPVPLERGGYETHRSTRGERPFPARPWPLPALLEHSYPVCLAGSLATAVWRLRRAALAKGFSGTARTGGPVGRRSGSGVEPLQQTGGTSRAEGATASSWPLTTVIEGHGRIKARALALLSSACPRRNYQDPPGSRVSSGRPGHLGHRPGVGTSALTIWKCWPMPGGFGSGCSARPPSP